MRLARYSMLLALIAAASAHSVAQAATVQDQFEVRVTIEPTCTVTAGTASDIDLGSQPATGTDVTGSNTISVTCSDTTPYTVGLEPSNAATDGAGNAQVVLTDVSGRITTLDFSIYDTPLLLRQGLADWSVEAGAVREDYGLRSFAYDDDIFGSANIRYGLTNWFTAEAHGEVANGYGNGGAGGALLLRSLGVLSGAAAVSRSHGRTGHVLQGGYSWTNGIIRIGGEIARASRDYTDLAGRHGADYPRERDVAYAGYTNPRLGSFSLNYVNQRYPGNDRFRYVALGWQKPLSRQWWVRLRAQRELAGEKRTGFLVTLSWAPGNGTNFGASVQTDDRRTIGNIYARRSAPLEGGIGWYASGWTDGDEAGGFGQIDYRSAHGEGTLGATVRDDTVSGFAAWRGSMVFMDGGLYAARPIQDSFALVSTSGVEDVPILLYNRELGGRTPKGACWSRASTPISATIWRSTPPTCPRQ